MTSYFSNLPTDSGPNGSSPSPSSPLSPPTANSSQRSTALANKLTSVLSSSYADSDIRDALETLDARGVRNTAETRRQLRLDVQKEVIDCNGEIIQDFGKVAEQLKRIGSVISSLNKTCADMRHHITLAKQEAGPALEEASGLTKQKGEIETKQQLLEAFNKHFIIPEEDILALTSLSEPVDDRFFRTLGRVQQLHRDCELLLGGENQNLGMELMEQSSRSLNSGFQKLYKWIQKEFQSLNLEDPQMSGSIRRALRVLAERPSLFNSCLDAFAEARETILSDAFHFALTDAFSSTENDRTTKPIEFSAHDPLRYVGDMLAWIHSATVSEREALEALFVSEGDELAKGIQAGINSEPWNRPEEGEPAVVFDGQKSLSDLVNRDLNGVARSLRQRVELVINGHEDPITVYKVMNLLTFYHGTFSKLIGKTSNLSDTITALEKSTFSHFETLMQDQVAMVSSESSALVPPPDLSLPIFLSDALENLTSLLKAYDTSYGTDPSSVSPGKENNFTPVLRAALDPFLDLARSSSETITDHTAHDIFQINILLAVHSTITPYPFASATHSSPITTSMTALRTNLFEIQHSFLLKASGLQSLLSALEPFSTPASPPTSSSSSTSSSTSEQPKSHHHHHHKPPTTPQPFHQILTLPSLQPASLSTSSQQLDDFLPSALMDAADNLKRVHSPALVKSVTEEAVEAFCRDFEFVEGMIVGADEVRGQKGVGRGGDTDGEEGSEEADEDEDEDEEEEEEGLSLRALFPRTTGEIRVLLS
ncbi:Golgi transport complex subunit 6 [Arachnomyces sp. PD_36]|nr:Golgi transport complex subunit 6 [Arachnomyces sp. PD_36]